MKLEMSRWAKAGLPEVKRNDEVAEAEVVEDIKEPEGVDDEVEDGEVVKEVGGVKDEVVEEIEKPEGVDEDEEVEETGEPVEVEDVKTDELELEEETVELVTELTPCAGCPTCGGGEYGVSASKPGILGL